MPVFKIKKISAEDGRDIYDLLQTLPKEENGLINKANGLSYEDFKSWLTAKRVRTNRSCGWMEGSFYYILVLCR